MSQQRRAASLLLALGFAGQVQSRGKPSEETTRLNTLNDSYLDDASLQKFKNADEQTTRMDGLEDLEWSDGDFVALQSLDDQGGGSSTFLVVIVIALIILFSAGGYLLFNKFQSQVAEAIVVEQPIEEQQQEPLLTQEEDEEEQKSEQPEEKEPPVEVIEEQEEEKEPLTHEVQVRNARSQREVISIHVGGAGCNLGGALWELFCNEHGISVDGQSKPKNAGQSSDSVQKNFFFTDKMSGKMVPRSIFIDLEPGLQREVSNFDDMYKSPIDKIRSGPFKNLFDPEQLLADTQGGAMTYGDGYYSQFMDEALEGIRKVNERCDSMQGFLLFNSIGGATGSGFSSALLERISDEYDRKSKLAFSIYPSWEKTLCSGNPIEPYNSILHLSKLIHNVDLSFTLQNSAMYRVCRDRLGIEMPKYGDLNRLMAQVISSVTVSLRRQSDFNIDIGDLATNLVPFHKRHFMLTSFAPLRSSQAVPGPLQIDQMTQEVFEPDTLLADCEQKETDKTMACCLVYRGNTSKIEANQAVEKIGRGKTVNFVDWCPTGFKVGINNNAPGHIEDWELAPMSRQVTMISNSTSVQQVFGKICQRFDGLFQRDKAYMQHYLTSQIEEMELVLAREDINTLNDFYDEVKKEKKAIRSNRISYLPPEASEEEKKQVDEHIQNVFENRRSAMRKSVMIEQVPQTDVARRQSRSIEQIQNRISRMAQNQQVAPSYAVQNYRGSNRIGTNIVDRINAMNKSPTNFQTIQEEEH